MTEPFASHFQNVQAGLTGSQLQVLSRAAMGIKDIVVFIQGYDLSGIYFLQQHIIML